MATPKRKPKLDFLGQAIPWLHSATMSQALAFYAETAKDPRCTDSVIAGLGRGDRFFLLTHILNRHDAIDPWLYERCREVEADPDDHLDLWARGHYKSTIITFAGIIQEILINPDITVGIFSHTRPIAKAFLRQIKNELEMNEVLKGLYPGELWAAPRRESPLWSEESGIVVRRKANPNEATVEAWGLVDGQPTSKHYKLRIYDDVVTRESVTTGEQIAKTTECYELSLNLSSRPPRQWMIGTRYSFADTYKVMMERGGVRPRVHAATEDGTPDGKPVFLSQEELDKKKMDQGPYTFACHVRGSTVLMADWSYKKIEDVRAGDVVVGLDLNAKKTSLVPTKVLATRSRRAEATRYYLESGHYVECTPDHMWWTSRRGKSRKAYSSLGKQGYGNIRGLVRIAWDEPCPDIQAAAWLSGMIDGEGTVTARGQRVSITQSHEHNPDVVERLRHVMRKLSLPFSEYLRAARPGHKAAIHFGLNGGRPTRHRLLLWHRPAKDRKIVASMFGTLGRFSPDSLDKVSRFEPMGEQEVFTLQTETGNYIANGYASKNCQMLQNPVAGQEQDLKPEWIRTYEIRPTTLNVYILGDPADSKEKATSNTAFAVIGVDAGMNKYLLDGACHKMNLKERWEMLKGLHRKWSLAPGVQMVNVGYEKYGMQADLQHFEQMMELEGYAFPIQEVSWTRDGIQVKDDRIRRLVPDLSSWRFYWPYNGAETATMAKVKARGQEYLLARPIKRKNHDGKVYNLVEWVIVNEYTLFPATTQKDFLDALSRLYDMDPKTPVVYDEHELVPTTEG
jgi:hypothetical protein